MSWFLAFAGFAALIILHEAGHFAAAKAVGMRVERFMLFFPPILGKVRRGETEYGIGAIPLGGYVKITGMSPHEDIPSEHQHRAYLRQPVWKRIVVIAAGPAVNLVLAFLLLLAIYWSNGVFETALAVDSVQPKGAAVGRLQPGDRILSVDGRPGYAQGLSQDEVIERQQRAARGRRTGTAAPGAPTKGCVATTPARVVVLRDGKRLTLRIRPRYDAGAKADAHRLQLRGRESATSTAMAPRRSRWTRMWSVTTTTVDAITRVFYDPQARKEVSGVVGSYETTRQYVPVRTDPGAVRPRADLPLAGRRQPLPVPAARRRAHLLGAGREGPRAPDPLRAHRARERRGLPARRLPVHHGPEQRHRPVARRRASASDSVGPWSPARCPRSAAPSTRRRSPRPSASPHASAPDEVAVRTKDDAVQLTWGELRERVDALAGGLSRLGVRPRRHRRAPADQPPRVLRLRPGRDDVRRTRRSRSTRRTRPTRSPTWWATRSRAW